MTEDWWGQYWDVKNIEVNCTLLIIIEIYKFLSQINLESNQSKKKCVWERYRNWSWVCALLIWIEVDWIRKMTGFMNDNGFGYWKIKLIQFWICLRWNYKSRMERTTIDIYGTIPYSILGLSCRNRTQCLLLSQVLNTSCPVYTIQLL